MEMSLKAKNARAEYWRRYRKENPEKVAQNQQRYWERKAEQYEKEREKRGE